MAERGALRQRILACDNREVTALREDKRKYVCMTRVERKELQWLADSRDVLRKEESSDKASYARESLEVTANRGKRTETH